MDARTEPSTGNKPPAFAVMPGRQGRGIFLSAPSAKSVDLKKRRPSEARRLERECLATGDLLPQSAMVRFVVGPEEELVADLAHRLPGRGFWVKAERTAIERALSKNLFAKAARTCIKIPTGYLEQIETLLCNRCLDFWGLAKGAGETILGETQVKAALHQNCLALLFVANDAGNSDILELAVRQAGDQGSGLVVSRFFRRDEMGKAFGYTQIVYAGIKKGKFADKIILEQARLEKIAAMPHIQ